MIYGIGTDLVEVGRIKKAYENGGQTENKSVCIRRTIIKTEGEQL